MLGSRSTPGSRRARWILPLVLLLALAARVFGIGWGLPAETHRDLSYHGGEWRAVSIAMTMAESLDLEPIWKGEPYFHWGSHYLYAACGAELVARAVGYLDYEGPASGWSAEAFARGHVVARLVSALYSAATVLLVYLMGRAWYGRGAGLLAAALCALCPLLAYTARFASVNACTMFWCTATLALQCRAARRGGPGGFLVAGLAVGLAVAAKLSALPLLATGFLAAGLGALRSSPSGLPAGRLAGWIGVQMAGALAGFALASPYAFLRWSQFAQQALRELFHHSLVGHGLVFESTGNGLVYLVWRNLLPGLGWSMWALCLLGLAWAAVELSRAARPGLRARLDSPVLLGAALGLAWIAINAVGLSIANTRFLRYLMPLVPILCLFAARLAVRLAEPSRPAPLRMAVRVAVALVLVHTSVYLVAQLAPFSRPDPRDRAVEWFAENVPAGSGIGLVKRPSHLHPPLQGAFRAGVLPRYRFLMLDGDPERLLADSPDYVVLNPMDIQEELRLGRLLERDPDALDEESVLARVRDVVTFWDLLQERYEMAAGPWKNRVRLLGLSFEWDDPPRGWSAATQEIGIWRRKGTKGG